MPSVTVVVTQSQAAQVTVNRPINAAVSMSAQGNAQIQNATAQAASIASGQRAVSATITIPTTGANLKPKIEKFSRTVYSGYTLLTANQLAGSAIIETEFIYRVKTLMIFRNGVLMEREVEYSEALDRTGFTLIGSYDAADKFEVRYVKF